MVRPMTDLSVVLVEPMFASNVVSDVHEPLRSIPVPGV